MTMTKMRALLAVLGCAACAGHAACTPTTVNAVDENDAAPQLTQPTPDIALTDSEIAAVMLAANAGELAEGNLAPAHASRSDVKTYASKLVASHSALDARERALFGQLAITPAASATSTGIEADTSAAMTTLQAANGAAFDDAYVQAQLTAGTKYLQLLAGSMIPSTKNETLLKELEDTRVTVGDELNDAALLYLAMHPADAGIEGGAPIDAGALDATIDAADAASEAAADAGAHDASDAGDGGG